MKVKRAPILWVALRKGVKGAVQAVKRAGNGGLRRHVEMRLAYGQFGEHVLGAVRADRRLVAEPVVQFVQVAGDIVRCGRFLR